MSTVPTAPKSIVCFTDQSADETLGPWIDARGYANVSFAITGTGTTSSGVVTYEECQSVVAPPNSRPFDATTDSFSVVATDNASDVTGGKQKVRHFPPNASYGWVRGRISTAVGGGGSLTLTAELS